MLRARVAWRVAAAVVAIAGGAAVSQLIAWSMACPLPTAPALLTAMLAYLTAHLLRAARVFLLLNNGTLRFSDVLVTHCHSAGISALIPFKLGEGYRVGVLASLCRDPLRAVVAVWIERIWDVVLLCTLAISFQVAGVSDGLNRLLWPAAGFLLASTLVFLVLPENLGLLKRYLVLRHNRPWVVTALACLSQIHRILQTAATIWRHRRVTIAWLSCAIWLLELLAVVSVAPLAQSAHLLLGGAADATPWAMPADAAAVSHRTVTTEVMVLLAAAAAPFLAVAAWRRSRSSLPRSPS